MQVEGSILRKAPILYVLPIVVIFFMTNTVATGTEFLENYHNPVNAATTAEQSPVRLPIVMYHHLSLKPRLWNDYVLSVEQFESDLKYLRDAGYESVTMSELLRWYDGEFELPERPVMITFDDGFESTLHYGAPLLERYGFKAVMAIVGVVADEYTEHPDHMLDYSYLDWTALGEAPGIELFELQCHTYDMHKLTPRRGCSRMSGESAEQYRRNLSADLSRFIGRCEEWGISTVPSIAFPFGLQSDETIDIVRACGYRAAFTCNERVNKLCGDPEELYHLCRFNRASGSGSKTFFARWE